MKGTECVVIALPRGRTFQDSCRLIIRAGLLKEEISEDSRKLIIEGAIPGVSFMLVRDRDVPTYIEHGACDMGVVGKDHLEEQQKNLYEPLDLKFGFCRLVVAEPEALRASDDPSRWSYIRIATKYPSITEKHFLARGVQVEVINLYGSIELAPLVGLSERIVDLVSTGRTLKENGLVEVEEIMKVTSRLVVNRASLKTKGQRVKEIIRRLEENLD